MKKSIAKISIILIVIVLLPTMFFTAYEISNLSQNEQVIDSIYSSQLSSIVFALNEYSTDAIAWHAENIDQAQISNKTYRDSVFLEQLNQSKSIDMALLLNNTQVVDTFGKKMQFQDTLKRIELGIKQQEDEIQKLLTYITNGYQKILPVTIELDNKAFVIFALNNATDAFNLCGLLINSNHFISEKLGPKMQYMGQDKFFITVREKVSEHVVYTNEIFDAIVKATQTTA